MDQDEAKLGLRCAKLEPRWGKMGQDGPILRHCGTAQTWRRAPGGVPPLTGGTNPSTDSPPRLTSFFDTFASLRPTSLHIASPRHFSRHFGTLSLHFGTLSLRFAPLAVSTSNIDLASKLRFFNAAFFATQRDTTHHHKPEHHPTKAQHGPNMVPKWSKMDPKLGGK
jgi:hypothetical protein